VIIANKWILVKTEDHTFVERFDDNSARACGSSIRPDPAHLGAT